jgi:glycosyltransferase involved in cell wall biosynthesis
LGEDTPVFLTVGHLFGWKRVDLVVDAIAGLRRRREARLLIVGEGLEKGRLDAQIQRHGLGGSAQTLGWVPDPREYARWATALVHASDEEGFAQVLIEAMSTHCPVIAVDALGGGPRFVTGEGRYGMLVPRGDSARLAGAMETMLESSVRERYAALGFQRSQCFSPRASAVALIDFLEMTRAAVEASAAMSEDRLSGAAWRDGSTSRTGSGSPV